MRVLTHTNSQARLHLHLRAAVLVVLVLLAALTLLPKTALATERVVRVGYPVAEGYETGGDGERKAGWGYEYLQELAYHTGWTYEYVYGDFSDLLDMLAAGEIDLLGNVSYTDERAEQYLYSANPQGCEKYFICGLAEDESLAAGDPQALAGKKIGVIAGVYQARLAQEWIDDEGVDTKLVEYPSNEALISALTSGEIEAVVNTDTASLATSIPVFYIGSSDYYIVTAPERADLLAEANEAMSEIIATNPHYNEEVRSGGGANNNTTSLYLTAAEQEWIDNHNGSITLGYLTWALPYSAQGAEDLMDGALMAFTAELESTFGIVVEARAYATTSELLAAVKAGEIDVAVPISGDFWLTEQEGLAQSDSIVTAGISLLTLDTQGDYLQTMGCTAMDPLSNDYLELMFTKSELQTYNDTARAISALRTGEISSLALPSASVDTIKDQFGLDDVTTIVLPHTIELSALLAKGQPELLDILNKAIGNSRSNVAAATLSHYSYTEAEGTPLSHFFEKNAVPLLVAFVVLLLAGIMCMGYALRRARAAETRARMASKAKTNFLNRMSHDIRTPLNGIIGLLEISNLHPNDTEILAQNRAKEQVAASHLLELLNDVLEMGRLEDADIELENKPFDMRDVLQDVLLLTRLRADENGVTLVPENGEELKYPYVIGSATSLRRILLNLLSNAVKYNKPGGEIRCTLRCVHVEGTTVTYRITVSDTGIGMSGEFLEHIFEPFSQEKTDARSTYQGSGMGMPIVRALVTKMGGTIQVSSKLGEGTTFVVEVPLEIDSNPEASRASEATNTVKPSIEGMHVLLVEDNELNRDIARELLEINGASVECAENGKNAVELFRRRPEGTYDVILMDVMMPVMNGYDAAREIRLMDKRDATDVPIVALTANAFMEDVRAAQEAGMNDHIAKPIDIDTVVQTLAKYRQ